MADFQYHSAGGTAWVDVPAAAKEGSGQFCARVVYPEATDRALSGAPCGATGKPRITMRSSAMSAGGLGWWNLQVGTATTTQSGTIYLTAFDDRATGGTPAWTKWVGLLVRPKSGPLIIAGATQVYGDVEVQVVECVVTV